MYKIFVIMPFGNEFQDMYNYMSNKIEQDLKDVKIYRADDLLNQQNILKDIVESIFNSNLIIADLTSLNPNVFYELGLAHTMNKDVILLTQDVGELPFDLRSYRVLPYSLNFKGFEDSMSKLVETIRETIGGKCKYSNPVSDFIDITKIISGTQVIVNPEINSLIIEKGNFNLDDTKVESYEDPGLFDIIADIEESMDMLTTVINKFSISTSEVGEKTTFVTEEINRINATKSNSNATFIRKQSKKLADAINIYSDSLESINFIYESEWIKLDNSLASLIKNKNIISKAGSKDDFNSFITVIEEVKIGISECLLSVDDMTSSAEAIKGLERNLTRATNDMVFKLNKFISLLEMSEASLERAVTFGKALHLS